MAELSAAHTLAHPVMRALAPVCRGLFFAGERRQGSLYPENRGRGHTEKKAARGVDLSEHRAQT